MKKIKALIEYKVARRYRRITQREWRKHSKLKYANIALLWMIYAESINKPRAVISISSSAISFHNEVMSALSAIHSTKFCVFCGICEKPLIDRDNDIHN